jgi:hypothetical protein
MARLDSETITPGSTKGKPMKDKPSERSGGGTTFEQEDTYWRENHAQQPYADPKRKFEHYAPAYRTGYEGAKKRKGKRFEEIETELALDYEKSRLGDDPLPWDHARPAVKAAWDRIGGVISPRDPDRGARYGI